MKSVKIVQSGDFHLDSPLALHHIEFRKKRREELLESFSKIIDHAVRISADLVLLTGDIFDSSRVTAGTLEYLSSHMSRFPGRIFISPGNHDPFVADSPYACYTFPSNTHIFRDYEEIHLKDLDCVVCGQGFTGPYEHRSLLQGRSAESEADIRILLLHGEVTAGSSEYNPMTTESIGRSGYSYIALGHRHDFSGILQAGQTTYAYAGIPEGRGFDELGDKGIIEGRIYKDGTNLSFRKMNCRNYRSISVDVTGSLSTGDVIDRITSALDKKSDIYKITLSGDVPSYLVLDFLSMERELEKILADFSLMDSTRVRERMDQYSENSLKGLYMKTISESRENGLFDPDLLDEAAKMGLRILSQEDF